MNTPTRLLLSLLLTIGLTLPAAAGSLTNFQGEPAELSGYTGKGQWTIVKIWVSNCHVCNQEAHAYVAFPASTTCSMPRRSSSVTGSTTPT
jgi:hypothetical protein